MQPVDSSAISEIGYDPASRRLSVRFASGELYAYEKVSAATNRAFRAADSKGRFFQEKIRDRYPYRRLS